MSTRDELLAAAEWLEEVSDYNSNPDIMAREKLAAAALREKASAVEGFDAWVAKDEALQGYICDGDSLDIFEVLPRVYAAGHAAASERVAELEAERTLLVAEVRRCWGLSKDLYSYFSLLWYRYGGYERIKSIPNENIYRFQDALSDCKKLSEVNDRPAAVRAIVEAQP